MSDLIECHHCGAAYPPDVDHHCMEKKLDEIREAVDAVKEAIESGGPRGVTGGGGFGGGVLYVLIGIGWGYGVAGKSDTLTGAVHGLLWPVSAAFHLAKYYWH